MQNSGQGKKFWLKVILVGLIAGLIGGACAMGVGNLIDNVRNSVTTKVPGASNKSGGTSVHKNKAKLNNESTAAYKSVKDSVVSVINLQRGQSDNSLFSLFGNQSGNNSGKLQTASEGSGVIYKKSGGSAYVVTNNHVVSGSNALKVIMSNGKEVSASIVGTDATTDLAVLKISAANVKSVASFGNSNDISAGQDVLAIGSPMGSEYANTVTKGIISAKKRTIKANSNSAATTVIQTDAAINSGNSGGPLINMAGQVIGINSMKLASNGEGSSVEGMGFSIPSNEVVKVINQLVANGKISRPSLGVGVIDLSNVSKEQQSSVLKLPSSVTKGAVVMQVSGGSAADQAGISKYDVIVRIGNHAVNGGGSLKTYLYKYKVGQSVKITFYHNGKKEEKTVKLTEAKNSNSQSQKNSQSEGSNQQSDDDSSDEGQ